MLNPQKSFKLQPLGDKTLEQWKQIYFTNNKVELFKVNDWAEEAIGKFWEKYDLKVQYKIEHKIKNFGLKSFNVLKAHYAIQLADPTENLVFTFRGVGKKDQTFYRNLVGSYLQGKSPFLVPKEFEEALITKTIKVQTIGEYLDQKQYLVLPELILPGQEVHTKSFFSIKNNDGPYITMDDYLTLKKNNFNLVERWITKQSSHQEYSSGLINTITWYQDRINEKNKNNRELGVERPLSKIFFFFIFFFFFLTTTIQLKENKERTYIRIHATPMTQPAQRTKTTTHPLNPLS